MEKYAAYKDSGVEWLEEIPQHWDIKPGLSILYEAKEKNKGMKRNTVLSLSYGKIRIKKEEELTGLVPESFETYQLVNIGDIIFRPTDLQNDHVSLRSGISEFEGVITSAYINIRLKEIADTKFYSYFFRGIDNNKVIYGLGSGLRQNIDYRDFRRFPFPFPPKEEQTAIANFLDRKTALIDQAIAIKDKQIELLKERRQILIHKAVTRGLNPNVKMKDSGVEWIGEVPEGWGVKKVKFLFTLKGGGTPSKERRDFWDGDIPWVSPKDMKSDYIATTEDYVTSKGLINSSSNFIQPDTLLMVVRSGILQRTVPVAISSVGLTINQDMKAFTPLGLITTKYFFYFIKGNDSFLINEWVKQGATVESVEAELLKNGLVTLPTIIEQDEIVGHIENLSAKISNAISLKEREIEKLKEYKVTLINSAVTGKIKIVQYGRPN